MSAIGRGESTVIHHRFNNPVKDIELGLVVLSDKSPVALMQQFNELIGTRAEANIVNMYFGNGQHHLALLVNGNIKFYNKKTQEGIK